MNYSYSFTRLQTCFVTYSPTYSFTALSVTLSFSQGPKSKSSIVASSGIFIPPSSAQIATSSQQPVIAPGPATSVSSTITTQQQVSTSGTFVPPGKSDERELEERSLLLTLVGSSAPRKRTAEDDEGNTQARLYLTTILFPGGPAVKQPCTSILPGEIFFKSNDKLK